MCMNHRAGEFFLCRREEALGDGKQGVILSQSAVTHTRLSVSKDGQLASFVDAARAMCLINTDGQTSEVCLQFPEPVHSAALSPDAQRYAIAFVNDKGNAAAGISVIDLTDNTTKNYPLPASPVISGIASVKVRQADAMAFSADGRWLLYDALNDIQFAGGAQEAAWSVYALDLHTGQNRVFIPPVAGWDIGNPSFSRVNDDLLTFEMIHQANGSALILAADLNTGKSSIAGVVSRGTGYPGYSGDGQAILHAKRDSTAAMGFSLVRQTLAQDQITPSGRPRVWMQEAAIGVSYRRMP
ncbi:MAG: hypothetical protein GY862_17445 [Gammaproteobacteria bacterium]|nr:hypothetical protein [Gammaproteobacteria bacterium]